MVFIQILCSLLIILTMMCLVENRSYNNGLIFYNMANQQIYLPPTISVSRGRGLAKFKYSPRGSIWSTFGKPCDCAGPLCGCCVGMKVKQYKFDQKICANVSYAPVKDEIQLEVILNDTSTAKYGIAARDPSPLCIPIMMGVPMSMCVQMSNVGLQGDNLNMCMDFMVRLGSSDLFEMHFQCMQVGLQGASWVGPNGQPVIPPSGGKLKDTSRDESEEYYDESTANESAENEIISKEKEMQMNSGVIENAENIENEDDLNKAEEELDYNDITEKIVETVNEEQKDSELMLEMPDAINKENIKQITKIPENVVLEDNKVSDEMGISKDPPVSQAVQESDMFQMMENNIVPAQPNSMEAFETDLTDANTIEKDQLVNMNPEDSMDTESNTDNQRNEIKESVGDHMEIQDDNDNIDTTKDENIPEKTVEFNLTEPQTTKGAMNIEMLSFTTEPNSDEEEETQIVEKFDMLVNLNEIESTEMSKTEHTSNNSLQMLQQSVDTSAAHTVTENFKPTLIPAGNVPSTTSEISNDSIDNALTTASIMTSTTTTTTTSTMKMPFLSPAENPNVPTRVNENNENDNDVHRNGEGDDGNNDDRIDNHDDDNSHENDSDYDDEEESEEYEDETTETVIETNDTATATKTSMSIATNVLDNDNNITEANNNATKTTTTTNENNKANAENSNESISNKENENENEDEGEEDQDDSKDVQNESDEYEDEEFEDYDTTTVAVSDTITHSLLNDTHAVHVDKSNYTNKAQMSHIDTTTISNGSNTLDVSTTSTQMPQFFAIPSSTATTTKTNTISSMTTAMPLPLARKILALHQHKQRQFQQQQRRTHSHRYDV